MTPPHQKKSQAPIEKMIPESHEPFPKKGMCYPGTAPPPKSCALVINSATLSSALGWEKKGMQLQGTDTLAQAPAVNKGQTRPSSLSTDESNFCFQNSTQTRAPNQIGTWQWRGEGFTLIPCNSPGPDPALPQLLFTQRIKGFICVN